ncbi:hypothetical protein MKZ38_000760 [Zalerion maritima]|uniref:Uncharacterized protein n=1 Tax=Zalerion maritima TaxID=339359 RepID=A0AAD5RR45_9PEZI|nr:hypothetical protein MKZ38_000760 [Zalerion maritima]
MMRPTTPNFQQKVGPTSPPETPRDTSPSQAYDQRPGTKESIRLGFRPAVSRPMSQTPHIKPTGNGHHFSYTRPDQLSPRSSSSSSVAPSESGSHSDSSSIGPQAGPGAGPDPVQSPDCTLPSVEQTAAISADDDCDCDSGQEEITTTPPQHQPQPQPQPHDPGHHHHHQHHRHHGEIHQIHIHNHDEVIQPLRIVAYSSTEVNFTLEELESDYDPQDSDTEDLPTMLPHAIEYPQSERSRSRSRGRVDNKIMRSFTRLGVHDDSDESDEDDELDPVMHRRIIQQIRSQQRRRRMKSGSIGKRTISESIGSDTDNEDVPYLNVEEVGSSARRLRRKYERHSFIFQDPPPPRIDEMDEPPSTDDEVEIFGKELPYWTMEIDSS